MPAEALRSALTFHGFVGYDLTASAKLQRSSFHFCFVLALQAVSSDSGLTYKQTIF